MYLIFSLLFKAVISVSYPNKEAILIRIY